MSPKCLSLRHFRWLAAHLASGMVSYGPAAEELIRDVLRKCRTVRPAAMAEIYVGAMKVGGDATCHLENHLAIFCLQVNFLEKNIPFSVDFSGLSGSGHVGDPHRPPICLSIQ